MSSQRFTPEFKEEAIRQIVDQGYSVSEKSECLGSTRTCCANGSGDGKSPCRQFDSVPGHQLIQ